MRVFKFGCMALSSLLIGSFAWASEPAPPQDRYLSQLDAIWAKMSDAERANFLKAKTKTTVSADAQKPAPAKNNTKALSGAALAAATPKAAPPAASTGSSTPPTDNPNSILGGCPGLAFTLRKSWTDIDYGACPQDAGKATGAMLSYSGDQIKHNDAWSAQGTAALVYSPVANGSFATGVYTSINKLTNSSKTLASSDIDTLGYGAFIQYAVDNSIPDVADWKNYFRLRAGAVNDNVKVTTNANVVAEWMPVYNDGTIKLHTPISIPGTLALFRIDPEIQAQYINVTGKSLTSAFNNRTEALPVGPQVRLALYPGTSDFWSHFVPSLTYWEAYEPYSARAVSWLDASLTYNLDKAGHLGLTLSYQKGNNVETAGTLTNIYTVSLTGKI